MLFLSLQMGPGARDLSHEIASRRYNDLQVHRENRTYPTSKTLVAILHIADNQSSVRVFEFESRERYRNALRYQIEEFKFLEERFLQNYFECTFKIANRSRWILQPVISYQFCSIVASVSSMCFEFPAFDFRRL